MIDAATLTKLADEIDCRLGPMPGPWSDRLAVTLRAVAAQIDGIRHPTGSEEFAAALENLGAPAPWRLSDEETGEILAANGGIACAVETDTAPDEDATQLALWIVLAVNTLSGFKAEVP